MLGAGTMGAGIAAHLANAGIPTLLLDIAPKEEGATDKNAIVRSLFEAAKKLKPAPFMLADNAKLITIGNFTDDIAKLKDCDFVIEAVVENLEIKHKLFAEVEKNRKPGAVIASNTSGIPIDSIYQRAVGRLTIRTNAARAGLAASSLPERRVLPISSVMSAPNRSLSASSRSAALARTAPRLAKGSDDHDTNALPVAARRARPGRPPRSRAASRPRPCPGRYRSFRRSPDSPTAASRLPSRCRRPGGHPGRQGHFPRRHAARRRAGMQR